jgi:apolipoprotein N-acyltransferase
LPSDRIARSALASLARELGVHLLVSSSGRDKSRPTASTGEWANSVFLFSPDGEIAARYDKIRLLPFNEYVPMRRLIRWPGWIATEMADAKPGAQRTLFGVGDWRFGALICWENLFASEFRDAAAPEADFMVSLTNESFAPVGPGREQLLALNAMRALENGLYVVRSATTGISGFIAPDGAILERVADERGRDLDVTGFRLLDVPRGRPTPYREYGDWIVALEAAILLVVVGAGDRRVRAG